MRLPGGNIRIIFGLILASTFTQPYIAFARQGRFQSSLLSSKLQEPSNLVNPLNLVNLPETEFTFSRVGWTAGTEYRSYSGILGRFEANGKALTADLVARNDLARG